MVARTLNTYLVDNVTEALPLIVEDIKLHGNLIDTRNGPAYEFPYPMVITYRKPRERVLFCPIRDANPFFHFMESMWLLAGRKDVHWIAKFNKRMKEYSDDGQTFHGSYGHRWRHHFDFDQLKIVVDRLRKYPNDRRTVLTMWDPRSDLTPHNGHADLPCNTHVYFKLRDGVLDMTVCNRSNDLIWGALGANVVHMSYLQEYIARHVEAEVGTYTQFTNNLHAYKNILDKLEGLQERNLYKLNGIGPTVTFSFIETFDKELQQFMNYPYGHVNYQNGVFEELVIPMYDAWFCWQDAKTGYTEYQEDSYNERVDEALNHCKRIVDEDWRTACIEWLERRI